MIRNVPKKSVHHPVQWFSVIGSLFIFTFSPCVPPTKDPNAQLSSTTKVQPNYIFWWTLKRSAMTKVEEYKINCQSNGYLGINNIFGKIEYCQARN